MSIESSKNTRILIQTEDFNLQKEIELQSKQQLDIGGIVTFLGLVRDVSESLDLKFMQLEHYPGMTEKALEEICYNAFDKWSLKHILIIHRIGTLYPGEKIVLVSVASCHRKEAFQATEYIMDFLKSKAPFWKKEISNSGSKWVDSRFEDENGLNRWLVDGA
tara:strand:- start:81 stop:566 length:486 start_codon:yes stop_codon:yes gene_type:complete